MSHSRTLGANSAHRLWFHRAAICLPSPRSLHTDFLERALDESRPALLIIDPGAQRRERAPRADAAVGAGAAARLPRDDDTPLLHLDTHVKLVQYIKLAMAESGLGSEMVRPPRLLLIGAEREQILGIIRKAIQTRPKLRSRA